MHHIQISRDVVKYSKTLSIVQHFLFVFLLSAPILSDWQSRSRPSNNPSLVVISSIGSIASGNWPLSSRLVEATRTTS